MEGGDRVESGVQGGEVTINKQCSECSALKAHVVQYSPEQCPGEPFSEHSRNEIHPSFTSKSVSRKRKGKTQAEPESSPL